MLFCMYSVEIVEFFSHCVQIQIEDYGYISQFYVKSTKYTEFRVSNNVILIVLEANNLVF